MRQVIVTGNIGKDAATRTAGKGTVTGFSVASSKKKKDGSDDTIWFDCSLWNKRGEALCQYLTKGTQVTVIGELSTRVHEGKTYLGIEVSDVALQGGKGKGAGGSATAPSGNGGAYPDSEYGGDADGDALPF
jgi:single-strand DNA-binding protein